MPSRQTGDVQRVRSYTAHEMKDRVGPVRQGWVGGGYLGPAAAGMSDVFKTQFPPLWNRTTNDPYPVELL